MINTAATSGHIIFTWAVSAPCDLESYSGSPCVWSHSGNTEIVVRVGFQASDGLSQSYGVIPWQK